MMTLVSGVCNLITWPWQLYNSYQKLFPYNLLQIQKSEVKEAAIILKILNLPSPDLSK